MSYDLAVTEGPDNTVLLHRADCRYVRQLANAGYPVATLYGCDELMPEDEQLKWHTCMTDPEPVAPAASAAR